MNKIIIEEITKHTNAKKYIDLMPKLWASDPPINGPIMPPR